MERHWQWHSKPWKADAEDGDGSGTEEDEADVINQTKTDDDYKLQMQVNLLLNTLFEVFRFFRQALDTNKQNLPCVLQSLASL